MSRFVKALLIVAVAALGVRVGYVLLEKQDQPILGDQKYYTAQADVLARGGGFTDPEDGDQTAEHPPLTALVLTPVSWIGDQLTGSSSNQLAHRLTMSVLGVGVVVLIALLGRMIAGDRVGLIAGAIAALYPNLWVNDGSIMSETLTAMAVALAIMLGYRLLRRPSWGVAVGLGVVCGLAMLVRAELGLLLPIMVLPLVFRLAERTRGQRLRMAGLILATSALVVSPWIIANLTRFQESVLLSTNDGLTICGANHPFVYSGSGTGLWVIDCARMKVPNGDRSVVSNHLRTVGLDYAADHLERLPIVVSARVARVWSVYAPGQMVSYNTGEGREELISWLGFGAFWVLTPLAMVGAWMLHRRRAPLWPLLAQVVMVTVTAALVYGLLRFRVPAEVPIVVLAAVAIDGLIRRGAPSAQRISPVIERGSD